MNEHLLDKLIAELAHIVLTEGQDQFEQQATEKSKDLELSEDDLRYLKKKLHNPPETFPKPRSHGWDDLDSGWRSANT
jgi:hypothetical protein